MSGNTLLVGDLHLGKGVSMGKVGIGTTLNSRIQDQFTLMEWILDTAIDRHVSKIILLGDIYEDLKPDYILVTFFCAWLKNCEHHGIIVEIIAGNHDIKRSGSHYTSPLDIIESFELSNVRVYKHVETVYNGPVGFTLLPFRDRKSFDVPTALEALDKIKSWLKYEVSEIPRTYDKVLVGHLALEGSLFVGDEIDDAMNELMCPPHIFEGYDYVWMGHVHKPQVLSKNPYQAHVGSLDLSNFGETDHTKILVLFNPSLESKFEHIPVPSRPLRRLRVTVEDGQDTTETILSAVSTLDSTSPLKNSIFKIEAQIKGVDSNNSNRTKIEDEVYQKYGVFHISSFTESRQTTVVPQDKKKDIENTINAKMAIKMYCDSLKLTTEEESLFIQLSNEIVEEVGVE